VRVSPLDELARSLCRIFLGWKLQEDFEALFAASTAFSRGRQVPTLKLTCRSHIATADGEFTAEASNRG
jgi:hypothetical protein